MSQVSQQNRDVCDLVLDGQHPSCVRQYVWGEQPLKLLEQFARLDGNSYGKILWRVELFPITLAAKV